MNKIKLGAQLYTLRDYIKTYEDTEKTFKFLNSIGVHLIQISGIGPIEPERVAELVNKYSMEVCVTHSPYDRMKNDLDNLVREHKLLGCTSIGIGSMPREFQGSREGVEAFIKEVGVVAANIKAAGMQFTYHNHAFEFERFDGKTIMDMLIEETDPDNFHFTPDTHWFQFGGVNPPDALLKLKGRVEVCHFKDYKIEKGERKFAEIGTGTLNLDACFEACQEVGVKYIVIEQDLCDIHPYDSMEISYKNLLDIAARHQ